jgi:hypothetical protein
LNISPDVSRTIEFAFCNNQHPALFMRRLYKIHCVDVGVNSLWLIHPFLGHNLTEFSIDMVDGISEDGSLASMMVVDALRYRCPLLEQLTILGAGNSWFINSEWFATLSLLVCSLQHLQRVHFCDNTDLDPQSFVHLASLPDLQSLATSICKRHVDQIFSAALFSHPFPAVCDISIMVDSLLSAIDFLQTWISRRPVRTIHIHVFVRPMAPLIRNFFKALVEHCLFTSITEINICNLGSYPFAEDPQHSSLNPLDIKLLLVFTNLEVLKINTTISTAELDYALLVDIASAWPHLCVLEIHYSKHNVRHSPKVMINGLAALSKCRALSQLGIAFDSNLPLHPFTGEPQDNLKFMTFVKLSLTSPTNIFAFFSQTFLNVLLIKTFNDHEIDLDEAERQTALWNETKQLFWAPCGDSRNNQIASEKTSPRINN